MLQLVTLVTISTFHFLFFPSGKHVCTLGAKAFGAMSFVPNSGPLNSDQDEELVVLDSSGRMFHFSRLSARLLAEASAGGGAPKSTLLASLKRRMVTQTAQLDLLKEATEEAASASIQLVAQWLPTLTRVVVLAATIDGAATVESWEVCMDRSEGNASGGAGQAQPPRCTHRGTLPPIEAQSHEGTNSASFALVPQSTASLPFDTVARVAGTSVEWWAAPPLDASAAGDAVSSESPVAWALAGAWNDENGNGAVISGLAVVSENAVVAALLDGTTIVQLQAATATVKSEEESAPCTVAIAAPGFRCLEVLSLGWRRRCTTQASCGAPASKPTTKTTRRLASCGFLRLMIPRRVLVRS